MNNDMVKLLYGAWQEYKTIAENDKKYIKIRDAVSSTVSGNEVFNAVYMTCDIKTDWIEQIESGINYIHAAIDEERQFILQEGNIVPIENARRISRASVEHLSKHSNLITHEQSGEEILPEKIYIKENLSNYLVYENRFLYMVICYLRDFVDLRYNKIIEADNTYYVSADTDRKIKNRSGEMRFKLSFFEKTFNYDGGGLSDINRGIIHRIEEIRYLLSSFLRTELMQNVSKAPMLHPPITQTNILKMDTNFREVFKLYEAVASYTGDGYSIIEKKVCESPFSDKLSDNTAESALFQSFAFYMRGTGAEEMLALEYAEAKRAREIEEIREKKALADRLRGEIGSSEKSLNDFLIAQSEYIKLLEKDNSRLLETESMNRELKERTNRLEEEKEKLVISNDEIGKKLVYESEKSEREKKSVEDACTTKIADIEKKHDSEKSELLGKISALSEQGEALEEEKALVSARLRAALSELGRSEEEDFTTEEGFGRLEKEREVYEKFFSDIWKETKKSIRSKYLWKGEKKNK